MVDNTASLSIRVMPQNQIRMRRGNLLQEMVALEVICQALQRRHAFERAKVCNVGVSHVKQVFNPFFRRNPTRTFQQPIIVLENDERGRILQYRLLGALQCIVLVSFNVHLENVNGRRVCQQTVHRRYNNVCTRPSLHLFAVQHWWG